MNKRILLLGLCLLSFVQVHAFQDKGDATEDSTKKKLATKELPLEPERSIEFNTKQGTWMSLWKRGGF